MLHKDLEKQSSLIAPATSHEWEGVKASRCLVLIFLMLTLVFFLDIKPPPYFSWKWSSTGLAHQLIGTALCPIPTFLFREIGASARQLRGSY